MTGLGNMIRRNTKLFFRDKGMFFVSLITPGILLLLYTTFLGNVFRDSFSSSIPEGLQIDSKLINAMASAQLVSSLLAVSCVTVAFCSNMVMIRDRLSGARGDFGVTPVSNMTLAVSYFISSAISTLIICFATLGIGLIYIASTGWYLTVNDVLLLVLDTFLAALFGTTISAVINSFVRTQGQMSAVSSIVSSAYGFVSGAYMPISQFSDALQKVIYVLPGTYVTSLFRNHTLAGVVRELDDIGMPSDLIYNLCKTVDCYPKFMGHSVSIPAMYGIVFGTTLLMLACYILINKLKNRK